MAKKQIPETSLEAYRSLDPEKLRDIYKRILLSLTILQEATSEEIATHIKTDHSRVWKRMPELVKMGLIYKPGHKKTLRSGCLGYCYRIQEGTAIPTVERSISQGDTVIDFSRKIEAISKSTTFKQTNLFD